MTPTPPPPEPIEPPVWEYMLPAGGPPYDGLFRRPSMLMFAGTMHADRNRHDLPNPLLSIEPLFPQLSEPTPQHDDWPSRRSSQASQRSDRSEPRSRGGSPPPSPPRPRIPSPDQPDRPDHAFDHDPFRTLPPLPGTEPRPFPLPAAHWQSRGVTNETLQADNDTTYGGPSSRFLTSADLVPWHVVQDWKTSDYSRGGDHIMRRDLIMHGRGNRRHIRVFQKKAGGSQARGRADD